MWWQRETYPGLRRESNPSRLTRSHFTEWVICIIKKDIKHQYFTSILYFYGNYILLPSGRDRAAEQWFSKRIKRKKTNKLEGRSSAANVWGRLWSPTKLMLPRCRCTVHYFEEDSKMWDGGGEGRKGLLRNWKENWLRAVKQHWDKVQLQMERKREEDLKYARDQQGAKRKKNEKLQNRTQSTGLWKAHT